MDEGDEIKRTRCALLDLFTMERAYRANLHCFMQTRFAPARLIALLIKHVSSIDCIVPRKPSYFTRINDLGPGLLRADFDHVEIVKRKQFAPYLSKWRDMTWSKCLKAKKVMQPRKGASRNKKDQVGVVVVEFLPRTWCTHTPYTPYTRTFSNKDAHRRLCTIDDKLAQLQREIEQPNIAADPKCNGAFPVFS